ELQRRAGAAGPRERAEHRAREHQELPPVARRARTSAADNTVEHRDHGFVHWRTQHNRCRQRTTDRDSAVSALVRSMKRAITVLAIFGVIGAGAGAYYIKNKNTDVSVNTAPITRGEIIDTVGATGTLQAVTTVQVGSQVSGNISWLGADFNSIVHKGQVIARLDPALFQAAVEQARANLAKSKADVEHNQVALVDAQQKYTRAQELAARSLLPQSDLDAAKIAVDSAQAMTLSSQATVAQSQANLNQAQVNLHHTVITAPTDGTVIQRSVHSAQTHVSS